MPLREGLAAAVEQAWAERPWASGRAEVPVSVGSGSWTVYFLSETEVYIAGQVRFSVTRGYFVRQLIGLSQLGGSKAS